MFSLKFRRWKKFNALTRYLHLMKYLLTWCPRCRNRFYVEAGGKKRYDIVCPYCKYRYEEEAHPSRIKEVDYYWQLYDGLYTPLKKGFGKDYLLNLSGILMFVITGLFFIELYALRNTLFMIPSTMEEATMMGLGLAGMVFMIFLIVGAWSCIKKYSFALSSAGAFFGALNSIFWLLLRQMGPTYSSGGCLLTTITFSLSLVSLYLIIKNKKMFAIGY